MANHFGKVDEFIPAKETFPEYEERLKFFFEANDVTTEAKKRAVFLTVVGAQQYSLLKDLCQPKSVSDLTFGQLCRVLRDHHEPNPPKFLQRAIFEARYRKAEESPQTFIAELRRLAKHCEFGEQLEDRLCEKFARGINCADIQRKLLAKKDLKLKDAVEPAVATMKTTEAATQLQGDASMPRSKPAELHFSKSARKTGRAGNNTNNQPSSKKNTQPCSRCGRPHSPHHCKFKNAKCYNCSKVGHIAKVCRSKSGKHQNNLIQHNANADGDSSGVDQLPLFTIESRSMSRPLNVDLSVIGRCGERVLPFQLDTGASLSVINKRDCDNVFNAPITATSKILTTYTGERVHVYGEVNIVVVHKGESHQLLLVVIEGTGPPLVGRNWLKSLKLDWPKLFSMSSKSNDELPYEQHNHFEFFNNKPITTADIARNTLSDPLLSQVYGYVLNGWPEKVTNLSLRPFFFKRKELSVENGCLLWGARVIVPTNLKEHVLASLHEEHIGIARMKALARCYVWWPLIDLDIERVTKTCATCELYKNHPPKAPLSPWEWPDRPWQRVHMDFAGPYLGKMFLIIVDAHSKWIDVKIMNKITTSDTIIELRNVFSTFGLPETVVTDNGPSWTSQIFKQFLANNSVEHITSAPYHPATNGLAERAVQTFKHAMKANTTGSIRERVYRFLTKYRVTPHSTTGVSPAELMMNRRLRTHLDLLHPFVQSHVLRQQQRQINQHDKTSRSREIGVHDKVLVRTYGTGDKWVPGTVEEQTAPLSYRVNTPSHGVVRRHVDQVRETACDFDSDADGIALPETEGDGVDLGKSCELKDANSDSLSTSREPDEAISGDSGASNISISQPGNISHTPVDHTSTDGTTPNVRRSTRIRKAPVRFDPS